MTFYEEYFISTFGAIYTVVVGVFTLYIYINACRRMYGAYSEEYTVTGRVTWSEYGMFAEDGNLTKEALITYTYIVDGKSYSGKYYIPRKIRRYGDGGKSLVEKYPKGSSIKIYYSINNPAEHEAEKLTDFIDKAIYELFFDASPIFIFLNLIGMFFFYLATFSY
ncbi:DUF3592 domain-containing protein [Photobacterium alginatilyticum]|uniref:DUF3592 domain-containing protein n=1 Tax=Photobacterium alginatilyticum TaxID=1775171 RepID=A0ABW9YE24_9GAMM|nr:DUF3592 domain-containing protein [Photobacterium alginatilyticum]NBI52042.1 DUF3592 domain-containing protein [Photobacterium alginatilyticum]